MVSLVRVLADVLYTACYVGTGAFMSHKRVNDQVLDIEECTTHPWYVRYEYAHTHIYIYYTIY
jgi:hypothetical protein